MKKERGKRVNALFFYRYIDERWEIGGVSINRADVLAQDADFSLSNRGERLVDFLDTQRERESNG